MARAWPLGLDPAQSLLVVAPVLVAGGRAIGETILFSSRSWTISFFHYVLFYTQLQLLILAAITATTRTDFRRPVAAVSLGMLLAWIPPWIDLALRSAGVGTAGTGYWYHRGPDLDFFFPQQMVSESVVVWLGIGLTGAYSAWSTRSVGRGLLSLGMAYAALQWTAWGWKAGARLLADLAAFHRLSVMNGIALGVSIGLYALLNRGAMLPVVRRLHCALPWGLAAVIGARLSGSSWPVALGIGSAALAACGLALALGARGEREPGAARDGVVPAPARLDPLVLTYFLSLLILLVSDAFPGGLLPLAILVPLWAVPSAVRTIGRSSVARCCISGATAVSGLCFGMFGADPSLGLGACIPSALVAFVWFCLGQDTSLVPLPDGTGDAREPVGSGTRRVVGAFRDAALLGLPVVITASSGWEPSFVAPLLCAVPVVVPSLVLRDAHRARRWAWFGFALYLGCLAAVIPPLAAR